MSVTTRDPIAVVQAAVDLAQAARQADALITEINEGDRALGDRRLRLGRLLRDVRRQIPTSGPRARAWGEFCEARGISRDTALRHIALADYSDANADDQRSPSEIYAGIVAKDSPHGAANPYPALTAPGPQLFAAQQALAPAEKAPPKAQPQSLPAANLPKPADLNTCNRTDLWQRFIKGELTSPEALERRKTWSTEQLEADEVTRLEYKAAVKAARVAGRADPPLPPMPIGWLTAGATPPSKPAADPAQAAAKALSAAEALGREDASRKSPRMIGEVVQRLRQASHLIPSGQDQAVYRAYCEARTAAVSRAAVEDAKTLPLPLTDPPKPAPYQPLFQDGPLAAGADAEDEDEDEFDDEDQGAPPAEDRDDEDDRRHVRDVLREELQGDVADLRRDLEAVRAELAQALRERDELRTKLAGAKFVEQVRDSLADEVRRLREEAGACGLVTCEADADDGDPCGRLAPPCPDGPALCQRHRQQAVKVAPSGSWQPASIGGAQAVHALPDGAVASEDEAYPSALCKQHPNYNSKTGWTPRPGAPLTCKGCIKATATNEETK